jgi:hypothetical protein
MYTDVALKVTEDTIVWEAAFLQFMKSSTFTDLNLPEMRMF